jgi:acetyl-CoA carboxylase alpha subunit
MSGSESNGVESLSPWDKVQLARHTQRPRTLDYVRGLCENFVELHGDRRFGDDPAIVAGLATFAGRTVAVSATRRAKIPAKTCAARSACRTPRATARRYG